ncbi:MAG: type III PLP-dependent enzyme [Proteobacteria bacterium]|nr:type III PLP-dependent enzyme [Pseudomonadota bacterium]
MSLAPLSRPHYAHIEDLLRHKSTNLPVFCYFPARIRADCIEFCRGFPGKVFYAVKANPEPLVLQSLIEGGIDAFDVASLAEIEAVHRSKPGAHCAFNHPVKQRSAIGLAYRSWGIRDFVVDHERELQKVLEETGRDVVLQVRVAVPNSSAAVSFNAKFGARPEDAVILLRRLKELGIPAALTMHLGWQTTDPEAYARGIGLLGQLSRAADVRLEYLNVGGGFPSVLMPRQYQLGDFFAAIRRSAVAEFGAGGMPLHCEPGSALVTRGAGVLTQVVLVKENSLYLNDGIYGAMAELIHSRIQPPTQVFGPDGIPRRGPLIRMRTFGPTCDSYDTYPEPFQVPGDTREGDWLFLDSMGAYSAPLITDFNGLGAHEFAVLDSP